MNHRLTSRKGEKMKKWLLNILGIFLLWLTITAFFSVQMEGRNLTYEPTGKILLDIFLGSAFFVGFINVIADIIIAKINAKTKDKE